ncbi:MULTISPECIES: class I SAM-dependent methyltransferase [Virgibacillus]|uniref:Malonyl-[acyl-carrier protein] O-methyltransferase n=1 Tax=Virgibacillus dokdonensis TaxID=302167 RepID=A0A2K9IWY6_9BACI|nr:MULTISPECIES: class I SAM-dependent methyltransferase [Virgibacillus]AUJ23944.1 Malonyl-[acyl-carrier protein] O-methyltransferase [Virgibacillus dokdonensis]NWO15108.1 class I SAM-dependent methyltransferase [Virgibacillus sp.]
MGFNWNGEVAKQWDERAVTWNERSKSMWETGSRQAVIPFLRRFLSANQHVLDIGCGDGYGAYKLYEQGYQVAALDISSVMVQYAKQKLPNSIHVMEGDVQKLPFSTNTFDAIMAINVLEWTENPKQALQELKRVVKERGHICVGILGPTAGPRANSYPRLHGETVICNTMMPWEFQQLCTETDLEYVDGYGVPKQGVSKEMYNHLPLDLQQSLSFSWIFMLRNGG